MSQTDTPIILTDPKPMPKDGRCPRCGAKENDQVVIASFGRAPYSACGKCGFEFKDTE